MARNSLILFFILILPIFLQAAQHSIEPVDDSIPEVVESVRILKIKDVPIENKANTVYIQALDKITAKTSKHEVKVGDSLNFERLKIDVLYCWKSSPEDISENKALLKITETKLNKKQGIIFYGWMFSSSIGLSTLEHPMYDITVIDCK